MMRWMRFIKRARQPLKQSHSIFNRIVGAHYHPERTAEQILALCKSWQPIFKPAEKVRRAIAENKAANKRLRIGMISDGFRSHPVGNMITIGLAHIPESQIELYAYSTNYSEDHITQKYKVFAPNGK